MTSKQKQILDFIISYIQQHGYSPTVQEIGNAVGYKSKNTTWHHIQNMLREGIIETDHPTSPRAIRVPGYKLLEVGHGENK